MQNVMFGLFDVKYLYFKCPEMVCNHCHDFSSLLDPANDDVNNYTAFILARERCFLDLSCICINLFNLLYMEFL